MATMAMAVRPTIKPTTLSSFHFPFLSGSAANSAATGSTEPQPNNLSREFGGMGPDL